MTRCSVDWFLVWNGRTIGVARETAGCLDCHVLSVKSLTENGLYSR